MSHVVTIQTEIKDLQAIKKACQRLGWTFKEGQQTYKWWGRWVDDSPVPEQLFSKEEAQRIKDMSSEDRKAHMNSILGKCRHAIQVPGATYEIGLVQQGHRWFPVFDWIGFNNLTVENGMAGFVQAYAVEAAKLQAQRQGHTCQESVLQDGTIKLRVTENY